MKTVSINTDFIKLDSLLKLADLVSSGGEGKMFILEGMVKYNGQTETRRGKKVYPGDVVSVNGIEITVEKK